MLLKIIYDMVTDYWKDTGTPHDIIHANEVILSSMKPYFYGAKEENVSISGNVMIGKGTVIKKGSRIVGPVIVGKECIIGPDTHIGPNISIGDNSKLSRCDIKNSLPMITGPTILEPFLITVSSPIITLPLIKTFSSLTP